MLNLIGPGVVVDPDVLLTEIDGPASSAASPWAASACASPTART